MVKERYYLDDGETIALNVISDDKFKLCGFRFVFLQEMDGQTAAADSLLAYLLEDTNEDYPDLTSFNSRLAELYGAEMNCSNLRAGDHRALTFSIWSIAQKYALDGEDIPMELLKLVCGCIFRPALEDGVFPKKRFDLKKNEMIDDINAEINDKRGYLISLARPHIYEGELSALPLKGTAEDAAKLTPETVYAAYRKMLTSARIEIFCAGKGLSDECLAYLRRCFDRTSPEKISVLPSPSPIKDKVYEGSAELDITQCKMAMAFKYEGETDNAVKRVFNTMFCTAPFSLLFKNVREKLSLCYYCSASSDPSKNTYLIDSGLEAENIDAAREEIMKQLDVMKSGAFSDELMEQAKLMIDTALKSTSDFPTSLVYWYTDRALEGKDYSPADTMAKVKDVTREDIIACANSLRLDTVFILRGRH